MASNERKRQKKLEKKKAKRKASKQMGRKAGGGFGPSYGMAQAVKSPIHECLMTKEIFEFGIGHVIVARKMPAGLIGVSNFLLDVYCLGVKNAFYATLTQEQYEERIEYLEQNGDLESIHPSCARKLVEGGVQYARDLGLMPHKDYAKARKIFGDIDPEACPREFEYGRDGMPLYVNGPNDTQEKSRQIIDHLTKRLGPDEFHYIVGVEDP